MDFIVIVVITLPKGERRMNELERHLREYLDIMANEPDGYIRISEVYHHIRRILGDE